MKYDLKLKKTESRSELVQIEAVVKMKMFLLLKPDV